MYEASEVAAIGAAHELILGVKPFQQSAIDSELVENRLNRDMDDIDEVDD